MASIIRSEIVADDKQHDGRRYVTEEQEDDQGKIYRNVWLIGSSDDAEAIKAQRAGQLFNSIKLAEIETNLVEVLSRGSLASVTLTYTTPAENIEALRRAYQLSSGVTTVMIGDFLNSLTDAQLRTVFGRTQAQITTLRTNKLVPAATLATQLRAVIGE